ncbi:hypothetical protein CJD36_002330 [Flavipsychrobacter stenotrophus]|uniref:Lipoprotein n=1 Tax=Flavipsychrobacter stenotrophus TaxID=2077091 RepID=A0A2S7T070_9BACT|nr:hypothetical protein [Flavipsychrobacter stenotrophus]PQJ12603.1 hypothetical protein CJD36_002330 [Flavipsychrobacter stenotrophus]
MRFFLIYITLSCIIISCGTKKTTNDLRALLANHSHEINGTSLKLEEDDDIKKLTPADTVFVRLLAKFGVLEPDHLRDEGCFNQLYYYGHFKMDNEFTGLVFAYSICNCCGDDQLILAIADNNGMIVSAIKAAEFTHPSECIIKTATKVQASSLVIATTEDCAILEGADEGKASFDSVTNYYDVTQSGQLKFAKKDSVNLTR